MNRTRYFSYIEEKLDILVTRINQCNKLNLLELNIHAEDFFAILLNAVFDLHLSNLNAKVQNIEGIDLIDNDNKIVAQVSSTVTKNKIEKSLKKDILKNYSDYKFKFIAISRATSSKLKKQQFNNVNNIKFNPCEDIWDIELILKEIMHSNIEKQRKIYSIVQNELGEEPKESRVSSNLATIINLVAKEQLDLPIEHTLQLPFAIEEKIEANNLKNIQYIIDDYVIYHSRINEIYNEYSKEGKNIKTSVLQYIKKLYYLSKNETNNAVDTYHKIGYKIIDIVNHSMNYQDIPLEELQMSVDIIVVDAFIRCKIFEKPRGDKRVITS